MCSPSQTPMPFPLVLNLLKVKVGFSLGTMVRQKSHLQQLASEGRRLPKAEAPFPGQPRERRQAPLLPWTCKGKTSRKATSAQETRLNLHRCPCHLENLGKNHPADAPSPGRHPSSPRDSQLLNLPSGTPRTTAAGAGCSRDCSVALHRGGSSLPAPCQGTMALPANAAAYDHRSGKINKDLLLQRPLKVTLLAALIGHFKERISDSFALRLLPWPQAPTSGKSRRKHATHSPVLPLPQHVMRPGEL